MGGINDFFPPIYIRKDRHRSPLGQYAAEDTQLKRQAGDSFRERQFWQKDSRILLRLRREGLVCLWNRKESGVARELCGRKKWRQRQPGLGHKTWVGWLESDIFSENMYMCT